MIYTYNPKRYEEAYVVLKEAVALDPSQLQGAILDSYFKATIDMVNNGKAEKMTVINVYGWLTSGSPDCWQVLPRTKPKRSFVMLSLSI